MQAIRITGIREIALIGLVNSVKWRHPYKKKIISYCEYFRYLHETNAVVFTILSAIKQAKFHFSVTIIDRISLFVHVIYSSSLPHSSSAWQRKMYIAQISLFCMPMLVIERWNLVHLMVGRMGNATMLIWWKYFGYLGCVMICMVAQDHLTENINRLPCFGFGVCVGICVFRKYSVKNME